MQISPPALVQPGQRPAPAAEAKARARAASDFEALLVTRLLKTARSAKLGDDLMGGNDQMRDLIDEQQGRVIAGAAPLGLAQLLARTGSGGVRP